MSWKLYEEKENGGERLRIAVRDYIVISNGGLHIRVERGEIPGLIWLLQKAEEDMRDDAR